ncbi:MAG: deoxyguanosinetriphosphate triphosphohydrolase, partial [Caulobacterales bacterium]|nr:deoxyguanosinetriphosphate triphosphohydrolase [Caulobacterales bacterium]
MARVTTLQKSPRPDRRPGERWTAPYACDPLASRGRRIAESESATRTVFQRDRDRVIHSSAFRRLKQKTQVFVAHEGDHYRTRLTHTLEVSQIARSLARVLGLDEELAETVALAHDLGHPPFGHAGERALSACMEPYGGFDHNAQAIRIVTKLEARYAAFDGLNLSWEALEGMAKHNGPLLDAGAEASSLPWAMREYAGWEELELASHASAEAQVAALADDIAYNNHDIDDGLRAGLFTVDDLADLPMVGPVFGQVQSAHPGLETTRLIHEALRRLIGMMVNDCVVETSRRLDRASPKSAEEVRALDQPVAAFSEAMMEHISAVRAFLWTNMYRHYRVNRM